jgi:hypothetical protein
VAVEKFLTEWRDPLTGVAGPGKTGGLKKMQEIFGEAACITGVAPELGGDSETVHILGRYNQKAIAFGIPDPKPEMNIHGFRGSAQEFSREMAPTPETSPELYWQDNILRSSDTSDASIRAVGAYEGPEALKALLAKMDRSRVRIIHVEIGALRNYLRQAYQLGNLYPPLKLAYSHPEEARLPAEARVEEDEIGAAYAKEEALVRWLAEDFFPANRGSRFISSSGLKEMTPPSSGFTLTLDELKAGTKEAVDQWGGVLNPPPYLRAGGRYLSLAESFQVMADALAELSRTGKLPASVRVAKVYGPISMPSDHGANVGAVSVASIARVCAGLVDWLHDQSWKPIPNNMIPPRVTVEGYDVNAGVFWRLMTRALLADSPDAKVQLKMTHMFSLAGEVFPKTRLIDDQGATWTYKPAPLQLSPDGGSAH